MLVKKIETMCMPPPRKPWMMMRVEATGKIYKQFQPFTYLGGAVTETPNIPLKSPGGLAHAGYASGGTYYVSSTTNRNCSVIPQDSNGKGRGNRGPPVWMQYVDPSPETLSRIPTLASYTTDLASHYRGTAQEIRPSDDLVQPCPRDNPV